MKTNLKNRPFYQDFKDLTDWGLAMNKWFERFKKELQQRNKQVKEIEMCQNCPIIDDILGENQQ